MWEEKKVEDVKLGDSKVLEWEVIENKEKTEEVNKKIQEFAKEFNDLQEKYSQYFVIGLVNKVNKQGEVNPEIKLILK